MRNISDYRLNLGFIQDLQRMLSLSPQEVADSFGISFPHYYRIKRGENAMTVQMLLSACNNLYVPSMFFITDAMPRRDDIGVERKWHEVRWRTDVVNEFFGRGGISWSSVTAAMGLRDVNATRKQWRLEASFPIDSFLDVCNKMSLSPWRFLDDDNVRSRRRTNDPVPAVETEDFSACRMNPVAMDITSQLNTALHPLLDEIRGMRQELNELREKYDALSRKTNPSSREYRGGECRLYDPCYEDTACVALEEKDAK